MGESAVGLAIIGVGRMGRFHARSLVGLPSVRILCVADAFQSSLDALGDIGAARYDNIDDALAHPGVEACLVATPTLTHPAVVRQALAAGLHVLCEKPLSLDPAESPGLGVFAAETGRVLQIGFWRRFSPPWRHTRDAIAAGTLGRPLFVRLSQWDADPPPPAFCDPAVSGGLAVDCGVHEFDLAERLTGLPIERVRAWSLPIVSEAVGQAGDVDNLLAVLELHGGAVAVVDLPRNSRYGDDIRTEILGSLGAAFIDILPSGQTRVATADGVHVMKGSEVPDATVAGVVNQMDAFAAAIRGATLELPGAAASARATRVALAVRDAAASGRAVSVAG